MGVVNTQTALCYVKLGILFPTGNTGMILCSNLGPFPGILNCGYRHTISHIQRTEVFKRMEQNERQRFVLEISCLVSRLLNKVNGDAKVHFGEIQKV